MAIIRTLKDAELTINKQEAELAALKKQLLRLEKLIAKIEPGAETVVEEAEKENPFIRAFATIWTLLTKRLKFRLESGSGGPDTIDVYRDSSLGLLIEDSNGARSMGFTDTKNVSYVDINPDVTDTLNLGSSSKRWGTINTLNLETANLSVDGNAGIDEILTLVESLGWTTLVLNYKDHSGANQTTNVVTSIVQFDKNLEFKKGIRTT